MLEVGGKTALVTGASRGIGAGVARGLAEAGASVGVNYLPTDADRADAHEVVQTIQEASGDAVPVAGDVSDPESVRAMVETVEKELGPVEILVNNAGIISASPVVEMSIETWDEILAVNLRGAFLVTREVLPEMLENEEGKIINIASQLGIVGGEQLVHYSASKGGLIAFTRALAHEVAPEVTVNAVAPGAIGTDFGSELGEDASRSLSEIPLERYGTVDDAVPTVLLLASSAGDYYTGQTLSPDGGDAMH
jgi:3-oxoacyl-[acyl-carrier protein] reductase